MDIAESRATQSLDAASVTLDVASVTLNGGFMSLRSAVASPSGRLVAAYGAISRTEFRVAVWDVGTQSELAFTGLSDPPVAVRFTQDETAFVIATRKDQHARVLRVAVGGTSSPDGPLFDESGIAGIAISRDSGTAALREVAGRITVLDTVTRRIGDLDNAALGTRFKRVAVSARGELLAATTDQQILVYLLVHTPEGTPFGQLIGTYPFEGVVSMDCGGGLVVAASGSSVRVVHGEGSGREVYAAPERIRRIALSGSGTTLAVAHGSTLVVVGLSTGAVIARWAASPVTRLTFRLDDKVLVTAHEDNLVRLWDLPPTESEVLTWQSDAAARDDALRRRPLARALASWLRRFQDDNAASSFLVQVDGPWGSGKSTLLNLLRDELRQEWLVVDFNAWRESKVGVSWWALLAALRRALVRDRKWLGRLWMRITETGARSRWAGAPFILAFLVLFALAAGFFVLLRPSKLTLGSSVGIASGITTLVTALGTLWAGSRLAGRFFLWDSARGAQVYQQSSANPMDDIARHFAWLIAKAKKPVVFFIDDLDRCSDTYVVELLETVQTLVRDRGSDGEPGKGSKAGPPCFMIAADGAWIRQSFEGAYSQFTSSVTEAGQPLGYLFLDKLFQLRVPVPEFGAAKRNRYLRQLLLGSGPQAGPVSVGQEQQAVATEAAAGEVTRKIRQSATEADVLAVLSSAAPEVRDQAAAAAVERLSTREVTMATEHWLQQFAVLLPPNPRAIKRFVNNYSILRAVRILEDNFVDSVPLALWTIIEIRWPGLADYLRSHPEAINLVNQPNSGAQQPPGGVPDGLRPLFTDPELARLTFFHLGGPMTPDLIAQCCGLTSP